MKKRTLLLAFLFLCTMLVQGQNPLRGTVSYLSSQHVYVRFPSTGGLSVGDTLELPGSSGSRPALVIESLSSTSCMCTPLPGITVETDQEILGAPRKSGAPGTAREKDKEPAATLPEGEEQASENKTETEEVRERGTSREKNPAWGNLGGRVSLASYSDLKNQETDGNQRLRYTLNLYAKDLADGRLSLETYASFSHTAGQWNLIRENLGNGLKVYNLSATWQVSESFRLSAGRKINPRLSSVGAIDGLQGEMDLGSWRLGLVGGLRPDYADYGLNTGLFQTGGYVGYDWKWYTGEHAKHPRLHGTTERRGRRSQVSVSAAPEQPS
ncbi:MAG: hypothetical protein R2751_07230 [Bacteroidales bacterium]